MINLLSPSEKLILVQEEKIRLVSILLTVFWLGLLSFALILLSIKIYISGELGVEQIFLEQKKLEHTPLQVFSQEINTQNAYLSKLLSFYQENFRRTEILDRISQALPENTYLISLNISSVFDPKQKDEGKYLTVALVGFSPTRDTVLKLKNNLEKEEKFQDVYFPPSNWVKPSDVEFSVSFKVKLAE